MVKITVDCYEIIVKMLIRKDYWVEGGEKMSKKLIGDKIQEGIGTPIDKCDVEIHE